MTKTVARIGFIVDGHGDFAALNSRSKGRCIVFKTDGPRGHSVSIKQLVAGSRKQIAMLTSMQCTAAVLVIDFEKRGEPYDAFVANLQAAIASESFSIPTFLAVANRMFENWFLADVDGIKMRSFIKADAVQKNYEGEHGKAILKTMFRPSHTYNEVKHGPSLFHAIEFQRAAKNSSSFKHFLSIIGQALN